MSEKLTSTQEGALIAWWWLRGQHGDVSPPEYQTIEEDKRTLEALQRKGMVQHVRHGSRRWIANLTDEGREVARTLADECS